MSAALEFKRSRFSIRVKLLLLISSLLAVALGSMILLASFLFRRHSETLIQEYNLTLARLIGVKIESELRDMAIRTELLAAVSEGDGPARGRVYADRFFAANPGYIFVGVADPAADGYTLTSALYNADFLRRAEVDEALIEKLLSDNRASLARAMSGAIVVQNLSPGFVTPALVIAAPREGDEGGALIALIDSAQLLRTFRSAGQTQVFDIFLVNDAGSVIAHSDPERAREGTAGEDMPIVKSLLESEADNRSLRYEHGGQSYLGSYQLINFGRLAVVSTVAADRAFEAVYEIQSQNLRIMLIVLALAFVFIYFFARTLTGPITRLVLATRQVEAGDYQLDIRAESRDEIGVLTNSFLHMARGLEEKERITAAFGKFVNPAIVNRARSGAIELGGETRNAAVLFTDLRNFTDMSERMAPHDVVGFLNEYFTEMVEAIHAENGVVDKFIGDAVMAHWGAIANTDNDVRSAVNAALAMRGALLRLNGKLQAERGMRVSFGVGVNFGPVLAGQIGSARRLEYTVIGDTVNLASRIEYLNKHFGTDILISEYAWREVEGEFRVVQMPPIRIKGKQHPEVVYAVLGRLDDSSAPRSLTDLRALTGIDYDVQRARKFIEASSDSLIDEGALTHADAADPK
jgi:adenylate cyclase